VIARVMLVGGKLVSLVDDQLPSGARLTAALEARKRAIAAKGLLMLSSALDAAFHGTPPSATEDGADHVADIVAAIAGDKRAVIDERRSAAQAATRERVRTASAAAQAAAATTSMPGELEDLGGGGGPDIVDIPDKAELERLRNEVAQRVNEMTKSMAGARDAATRLAEEAKAAAARGAVEEASQLERKADAERARMHALLAELATLESEIKELERAIKQVGDLPKPPPASARPERGDAPPPPRGKPASIDDELAKLKKNAGAPTTGGSPPPKSAPKPSGGSSPNPGPSKKPGNVDDELAALKKKMQQAPPKKKP
jgi:hypothetical protein